MRFNRCGGGHNFDFDTDVCTQCGIERRQFRDGGNPECASRHMVQIATTSTWQIPCRVRPSATGYVGPHDRGVATPNAIAMAWRSNRRERQHRQAFSRPVRPSPADLRRQPSRAPTETSARQQLPHASFGPFSSSVNPPARPVLEPIEGRPLTEHRDKHAPIESAGPRRVQTRTHPKHKGHSLCEARSPGGGSPPRCPRLDRSWRPSGSRTVKKSKR
jgi:hypothetical protein